MNKIEKITAATSVYERLRRDILNGDHCGQDRSS